MAFDFPNNPTTGQIFTPLGGPSYQWNGTLWVQASAPSGITLQQVYAENTAYTSTTIAMVGAQDTVPQQTDGLQILSVTISPKAASSTLRVSIVVPCAINPSTYGWIALFQDNIASALASVMFLTAANGSTIVPLEYELPAGATASTTFKVRMGILTGATGTLYLNGYSGGRLMGGSQRAAITVTELAGGSQPQGGIGGVTQQQVYAENTAIVSTTAALSAVNNVPQQTDGVQLVSATITPKSASNTLRVDIAVPVSTLAAAGWWIALFQDSTAAALASAFGTTAAQYLGAGVLTFELPAGITVPTTFKVRMGLLNAGTTLYTNSQAGVGSVLGGTLRVTLTITELAPSSILSAGTPAGLVLLNTLVANNSAYLTDLTSLTSAYNSYEIEFVNLVPVTDNVNLGLQPYGGGAWLSGIWTEIWGAYGGGIGASILGGAENFVNGSGFLLSGTSTGIYGVHNQAGNGISGIARLHGANDANFKALTGNCEYSNIGTSALTVATFGGFCTYTGPLTGFRMYFGSGNISTGTVRVYGRKTS